MCGERARTFDVGFSHILLMTDWPCLHEFIAAMQSKLLGYLHRGQVHYPYCIIGALPTRSPPYCAVSHMTCNVDAGGSDWLFCSIVDNMNLFRGRGNGWVSTAMLIWHCNGFLYFPCVLFGQPINVCLDLGPHGRCCNGSVPGNAVMLMGKLW
jgi:hypothetical protein